MDSARPTDPLAILHQQHGRVSEWLAEMSAVSDIVAGPRGVEQIARLTAFYRSHILPHFAWEEQRLFPALERVCGSLDLAGRIADFLDEHVLLQERIAAVLEDHGRLARGESTGADAEQAARRARLVLDRVLMHAAEEDDVFDPLLEQHHAALIADPDLAEASPEAAPGGGERPGWVDRPGRVGTARGGGRSTRGRPPWARR